MSVDTAPVHDAPADAGRVLLKRAQRECDPILRVAVGWLGEPLATMAGYHLGWWDANRRGAGGSSGKSIRSGLVLAAAAACGDTTSAAPAAAAMELLHNFSLLHDDVMDGDLTRRGRATVGAVWGQTSAILLGDAMHALADRVLTEMLEPVAAMRAVTRLESSALALCLGQSEDCAFETRPAVTVDEYLQMAAGKTASLIGCACALGALTAGADSVTVAAMEQFGHQLGLAFQIVDDVIGIWGDAAVAGKPVGNDLARRKATLPVVAALNSDCEAAVELAALYRSTAPMTVCDVEHATELVEVAGGRRAARRYAQEHFLAAMTALPDLAHSADLIALARVVMDRDR
jgi:geranylgeranyl diphosphate synthase, type I